MMTYKIPAGNTDCLDNKICRWMHEKLKPGFVIQLSGFVPSSLKGFELTALLSGNIPLVAEKLWLKNVMLKLKVGMFDPHIRIAVTLQYRNRELSDADLKFTGEFN